MIGTLSDKGLNDAGVWVARIDDVPYECLPTTVSFLERLEKGWQVEYHLNKENRISTIKRAPKTAPVKPEGGFTTADKLKKAGFDMPAKHPEPVVSDAEFYEMKARADAAAKEKVKAPDKPLEAGIKLVQGQITALDIAAHTITLKDIKGTHHEMMWAAPLNDKMAKLKQWWFCAISAEKSGEYWKVIDQQYYAKPADWIQTGKPGYSPGKGYPPRNERIIVLQSCAKLCVDVWVKSSSEKAFNETMDIIIARAIKDTDTLMKAGTL